MSRKKNLHHFDFFGKNDSIFGKMFFLNKYKSKEKDKDIKHACVI